MRGHWCVRGCGRRVFFDFYMRVDGKNYVCGSCGSRFSREMLGLKCHSAHYVPGRVLPSIKELCGMVKKNKKC